MGRKREGVRTTLLVVAQGQVGGAANSRRELRASHLHRISSTPDTKVRPLYFRSRCKYPVLRMSVYERVKAEAWQALHAIQWVGERGLAIGSKGKITKGMQARSSPPTGRVKF